MQVILSYPVWFILLCLGLGALYAWLLYFWKNPVKEKKDQLFQRLLASLRFLAVSLLAFFLLAPLIKTNKTELEKPILIFLQDNSASVGAKLKGEERKNYLVELKDFLKDISKKYEVKQYQFGDQVNPLKDPDFSLKETDISKALKDISEMHSNQNIGGVILASDGIYNKGMSPVYQQSKTAFPVYTIALGDTTVQKDLYINALRYSEVVYLGDNFNLNIEVRANHLQGKNTAIEVKDDAGAVVYSSVILINADDFGWATDVALNADKAGIRKYTVRVRQVDGELIAANNVDMAFVDVLDARQKILMLYDAPHPDVRALKSVIETNKNYQFDAKSTLEFSGSLKDYGLVILHGLPSKTNKIAGIITEINTLNKPVLYILSGNSDLNAFNLCQKTLAIANSGKSANDAGAVYNQQFSKFIVSPEVLSTLELLPPLMSPFGTYKKSTGADVAFFQQIGRVKTDFPLILLDQNLQQRVGVVAGEGLWRWRMHNYLEKENYDAFDDFFGKVIQYLSIKGDNRKFRLRVLKNIFAENEPVQFNAELYNESLQLVNDVDVRMSIKDEKGKDYPYIMDKVLNAYSLDAGQFPEGNYTATATCDLNGKKYVSQVNFTVKPLFVEMLRLQADHRLLYDLSSSTGGKMVYPGNLKDIANAIEKSPSIKPVAYQFTQTRPLMDLKWLFFLAAILLATEWFIRKFRGGY